MLLMDVKDSLLNNIDNENSDLSNLDVINETIDIYEMAYENMTYTGEITVAINLMDVIDDDERLEGALEALEIGNEGLSSSINDFLKKIWSMVIKVWDGLINFFKKILNWIKKKLGTEIEVVKDKKTTAANTYKLTDEDINKIKQLCKVYPIFLLDKDTNPVNLFKAMEGTLKDSLKDVKVIKEEFRKELDRHIKKEVDITEPGKLMPVEVSLKNIEVKLKSLDSYLKNIKGDISKNDIEYFETMNDVYISPKRSIIMHMEQKKANGLASLLGYKRLIAKFISLKIIEDESVVDNIKIVDEIEGNAIITASEVYTKEIESLGERIKVISNKVENINRAIKKTGEHIMKSANDTTDKRMIATVRSKSESTASAMTIMVNVINVISIDTANLIGSLAYPKLLKSIIEKTELTTEAK